MLYYLLFWAILGFIIHFYIIFGTNLLTGGPAQICCFMPISVFRRKGISNEVETERNQLEKLFLDGKQPRELGVHVRGDMSCPRGWGGGRPPPRARPRASWGPRGSSDVLHAPIYIVVPRTNNRSGVPPPEASVATESQSRPVPAPCRRGESFSGGHLHHPGALHDEEGVVLPRG